ncbi:MAG: autotransporter outer membrane beta-barrel domain-containing protein [Methylococcales bacterium]|nr:autotransporter outer membrane beta-barrel domain-containing protein [Methylococcaceae bacterium]
MQKSRFTLRPGSLSRPSLLTIGLLMAAVGSQPANALNKNETAVFNTLSACNNKTDGTSSICSAGNSLANVKSLNPDQIFGMGSLAARVNGGKTTQPADYFRLKNRKNIGAGAGDEEFSRLGFWGKVDSNFGSRYTTPKLTGFDFDNHEFVVGADYRLQDNWVVGSLFSYRHNNAAFDQSRGETDNDSYTGAIYSTYNITDALHVEGSASYGGFHYDTLRNINLVGLGSSVAKGSPDGGQYAFSWGGGYDFNIKALTIAPYARGEYFNLNVDGFKETGSIGAVQFGKQTIESAISTVGIQTSYAISFPWGVLIPQLRGEWHHQYLDGVRKVQTRFVEDPTGRVFNMTSGLPIRDYYTFGAEVSSVLSGGVSAFLAFETLQGYDDINSNKLVLGTRLEF